MQTFLGDIFSDLPEVSTFSTADRTMYAAEPQTPMQLYLRRDAPSWAASREHRARQAAAMMADTREDLAWKMESLTMLVDPAAMVRDSAGNLGNAAHLGSSRHINEFTEMLLLTEHHNALRAVSLLPQEYILICHVWTLGGSVLLLQQRAAGRE